MMRCEDGGGGGGSEDQMCGNKELIEEVEVDISSSSIERPSMDTNIGRGGNKKRMREETSGQPQSIVPNKLQHNCNMSLIK